MRLFQPCDEQVLSLSPPHSVFLFWPIALSSACDSQLGSKINEIERLDWPIIKTLRCASTDHINKVSRRQSTQGCVTKGSLTQPTHTLKIALFMKSLYLYWAVYACVQPQRPLFTWWCGGCAAYVRARFLRVCLGFDALSSPTSTRTG